ncbi:MAG: Glycerate kinase [Verrucomicrobiales bacterium]|nr:Glycerate kinase [Verrucomicrobiales bacterium]
MPHMAQRVLIAPDKFKGTLSASEAAKAIARGWRAAQPNDELTLLPMSDGGDGFGEVMGRAMAAEKRVVETVDAADRPIEAAWWWDAKIGTAIVEAALVNGLAMLPHRKFHPFQLNTFGLGRVLHTVARAGAKHCVVGIGGSATNDGGFGLARALGWKFFAADDRPNCAPTNQLDEWWQLWRLARIEKPAYPLQLKITVAVDVKNPLLGPSGCTRVYGPQKGLAESDFVLAEGSLEQLARIYKRQFRRDFSKVAGAGAAGGLGFGLMAFADAKIANGFELFAKHTKLRDKIREADLVITGEGAVDQQTFMGKGVGQLATLCKRNRVRCIALAGVANVPMKQKLFSEVRALTEITTAEKAKKNAARYLAALAKKTGADSPAR